MERMMKNVDVEGVPGQLTHFLVEPFVKHEQKEECYVCIQCHRYFDEVYFHHEGGVDVGDVDEKARRMRIPVGAKPDPVELEDQLLKDLAPALRQRMAAFVLELYKVYTE